MRRASTLGVLAAGLVLVAAAPASAGPQASASTWTRSRRGWTTRATSRSARTVTSTSPSRAAAATPRPRTSCFDSAEGPSCTGATGAITRIDRRQSQQRVVTGLASFAPRPDPRRQRDRPARRLRRRPRRLLHQRRPDGAAARGDPHVVAARPDARRRGAGLRAVREAVQARASRRAYARSLTSGASSTRTTRTPRSRNPLVDSNPVDVYADHGRFYVADAGGNSVLRVGRFGGISAARACSRTVRERRPRSARPADPGRPDRRGQGPGRRALHEPADRLPVPVGGRGERVPHRPADRRARPTYASGFTNVDRPRLRRVTARSTCSRSTTTRCSRRPAARADGALFAVPRRGKPHAEAGRAPGRAR